MRFPLVLALACCACGGYRAPSTREPHAVADIVIDAAPDLGSHNARVHINGAEADGRTVTVDGNRPALRLAVRPGPIDWTVRIDYADVRAAAPVSPNPAVLAGRPTPGPLNLRTGTSSAGFPGVGGQGGIYFVPKGSCAVTLHQEVEAGARYRLTVSVSSSGICSIDAMPDATLTPDHS